MKTIEIKITEQFNNKTVKYMLFDYLELSDKLVADLKKGEYIKVNGECCTVRRDLKTNDILKITIPESEKNNIEPVKGELDILFEDEDIIAVNKPANMPTHPTKYHLTDTLANFVCGHLGKNFVFRAVNRLDKDTTGVVLIAKNRYSAEMLNKQIRSKEIEKTYMAICQGTLNGDGIIEAPIKKETERGIKRIVSPDGQYAKTQYFAIKTQDNNTLVILCPKTGRTHQLRVHMAHIGHPLYGDYIYGKECDSRTLLHCSQMEFTHPETKKKMCINAHLPKDFWLR
ncbi:MAG: RluA family pseudouridine synthase [Clostridia bacterium]|nr:RluA family pseudouridine synthase [Clostridia bacterium]